MKNFSPNAHYAAEVVRNVGIWIYVIRSFLIVSVISFVVFALRSGLEPSTVSVWLGFSLFLIPLFYFSSFYIAAGKPSVTFHEDKTFTVKGSNRPVSDLNVVSIHESSSSSPNRWQPFYNTVFLQLGVRGEKLTRIHINFMSEKFIPDFKMLHDVVEVLLEAKTRNPHIADDVDAALAVLSHFRIERESMQNETAVIRRFNHPFSPPEHVKNHPSVENFRKYIAYINR